MTTTSLETADSILARRGWYATQAETVRKKVLSASALFDYADGEFLYALGDRANYLFALVEGNVKLTYISEDGRELLLKIFSPGDWFGLIGILDDQPLPHNAFAAGPVKVLRLSRSGFEVLVREDPGLYRSFIMLFCMNMRVAMDRHIDLGLLSPAQRVAKLLLEIDEVQRGLQSLREPSIKIAQAELCSIVCASRATISKLMREWQLQNWLRYHYGVVSIIDREALRALLVHQE